MTRLGVGIIGLGEVAQLMHLPVLTRLGDLFAVTAVTDVSPSVARRVGGRWHVPRIHPTAEALVSDPAVDVVFVLSPDQHHDEHATLALRAGKHVFVEKPVCLTRADAERLAATARDANRVVMVGYMRRFAPAFVAAKARLPELGPLSYVRVWDFFCEGPWFFRQTSDVIRPERDIPPEVSAASRRLREAMMRSACGDGASPALLLAWEYLTGVACHSTSAMRDLLSGVPKRVAGAQISPRGDQLTALLDYGDYPVVYEYLIDDIARFDAGLDLYAKRSRMRLLYDTPYIRNLPMRLEIQESTETANAWTILGPFYKDPFEAELEALHDVIVHGGENRTPVSDSLADFDIFEAIIAHLRPGQAAP
jgi:myo-inositol 2-dehydrogenase/D-chiro-inositol 1-dehydrogenase